MTMLLLISAISLVCKIIILFAKHYLDWFIAETVEITISGHQFESKISGTYKNQKEVTQYPISFDK